MPFVRIVERDFCLPHQVFLYLSPDQTEYRIACLCQPKLNGAYGHLTSISFHDLVHSGMLASTKILRLWREAHNPPLSDQEYADATASRWVWVDGGGNPEGFGAGQA